MASRGPMNAQSRSRGAARVFSFCSVCFLFRSTAQFWFGPLRADGVWQVRISGATHLCLLQCCGLGSFKLCRSGRPAPTTCLLSLSSRILFSLFVSFLSFSLPLPQSCLLSVSQSPSFCFSSLVWLSSSGCVRVTAKLYPPGEHSSASCLPCHHSQKSLSASYSKVEKPGHQAEFLPTFCRHLVWIPAEVQQVLPICEPQFPLTFYLSFEMYAG